MIKEKFYGDGNRTSMSVLVHPTLQKRLKVCAAGLSISRSTLIEILILDGLEEKEMQAGADAYAVGVFQGKVRKT